MSGTPVFIEMGNSGILSTDVNPCPSNWGLDVRQIYNTGSSVCLVDIGIDGSVAPWHVGYRGNSKQPWAVLSFFDGRSPSPEWFDGNSNYTPPTANNWALYEDEVVVARIDANNDSRYVYRLAHAYSRSDEDFSAMPRAAMSRDGAYIAFASDMAYAHTGCPSNYQSPTNCSDIYVIKIH